MTGRDTERKRRVEAEPLTQTVFLANEASRLREATLTRPEFSGSELPAVLLIGGIPRDAHNTDKRPFEYHPFFGVLARHLARRGRLSLAMNPAGMGLSEGDTHSSSISERIRDWTAATEYVRTLPETDPQRVSIVGCSMGGHIALRLLEVLPGLGIEVDKLVLISPAAYTAEAEEAHFNEELNAVLRAAGSLDPTRLPTVDLLRGYGGRVLLTYAEHELPVPPRIRELYYDAATGLMREDRAVIAGLRMIRHGFRLADRYYEPSMEHAAGLTGAFLAGEAA
jgi:pimeloyl-ACP methyl ester carboxylesterase